MSRTPPPILVASLFLAALLQPWMVRCDYFTAISDLEKLLHTEGRLADGLQTYIDKEEKRLSRLRLMSKMFNEMQRDAQNQSEEFLSNPLNAYLLVKRLTQDWDLAQLLTDDTDSKIIFAKLQDEDIPFPGQVDLTGAARALMRLHHTYRLNVSSLARGEIAGSSTSSDLTAADCLELGREYVTSKDFSNGLLWFQESLQRAKDEEVPSATTTDILEDLADAAFKHGDIGLAVDSTIELLQEDPDDERVHNNLGFYQAHLKGDEGKEPLPKTPPDMAEVHRQLMEVDPEAAEELATWERYEALCRGESTKTATEESRLFCYHTTNDNDFLLLQPVKVEILSLSPRLVMFHDIVSEREADRLKGLSLPKLERAEVQSTSDGELKTADFRISKSAWLEDGEHPLVDRINRRIEQVTGLTTSTAENLHVINYGIGGHYEPHWDFSTQENPFEGFGYGNRLATLIFYLSDVAAGGSTVFPNIGTIVTPRKGSAVFWHNLFRNGTGDLRTKHAACPVLVGSKWISNKWIHEYGQEFRRRCSIIQDEE